GQGRRWRGRTAARRRRRLEEDRGPLLGLRLRGTRDGGARRARARGARRRRGAARGRRRRRGGGLGRGRHPRAGGAGGGRGGSGGARAGRRRLARRVRRDRGQGGRDLVGRAAGGGGLARHVVAQRAEPRAQAVLEVLHELRGRLVAVVGFL